MTPDQYRSLITQPVTPETFALLARYRCPEHAGEIIGAARELAAWYVEEKWRAPLPEHLSKPAEVVDARSLRKRGNGTSGSDEDAGEATGSRDGAA